MTGPIHFVAAGTTRPACGITTAEVSSTPTAALVTCAACAQTVTTRRTTTPHSRTNR